MINGKKFAEKDRLSAAFAPNPSRSAPDESENGWNALFTRSQERVTAWIADHPKISLGTALLTGVALGCLIKRRG